MKYLQPNKDYSIELRSYSWKNGQDWFDRFNIQLNNRLHLNVSGFLNEKCFCKINNIVNYYCI